MKEHGLTQSVLANGIGYTKHAISKWINHEAEPTESAINRVANYFHVTSGALLGRTTDIYINIMTLSYSTRTAAHPLLP